MSMIVPLALYTSLNQPSGSYSCVISILYMHTQRRSQTHMQPEGSEADIAYHSRQYVNNSYLLTLVSRPTYSLSMAPPVVKLSPPAVCLTQRVCSHNAHNLRRRSHMRASSDDFSGNFLHDAKEEEVYPLWEIQFYYPVIFF